MAWQRLTALPDQIQKRPLLDALVMALFVAGVQVGAHLAEWGYARERGLWFALVVAPAYFLCLLWPAGVLFRRAQGPHGRVWQRALGYVAIALAVALWPVLGDLWLRLLRG